MKREAPISSRPFWLEAALLVFIVLVAYLMSLWNGFVFDDEAYVLNNPHVQGPLHLKKIFTENYAPGHSDQGLYRPLVTLSYWLDHRIWGFPAAGTFNGFHLTNLLLHAFNAILLFALLRQWKLSPGIAWLCAIVFAIHPAMSEAVIWISGRAELLAASFGLLALFCYFRYPDWRGLTAALFFWLLAMFSKEQWVMLPFAIAALQVGRPDAPKKSCREWMPQIIAASILLAFFWLGRFIILGSWHPTLAAYRDVVGPLQRATTALEVMWRYIWLWFFPVSLSVHHAIAPVQSILRALLSIGGWAFAFWGAWRSRAFFPWLFWALAWFWALMFPVSNLLIPIGTPFGERFLYSSTLLFAPMLALAYNAFFHTAAKGRRMDMHGIFIAAPICVLLLIRLETRIPDWKSNLKLFESASAVYPQSFAIKAPLADALLREGRFAESHVIAAESCKQLERQPLLYQRLFLQQLMTIDAAAQSGMRQMAWVKRFFLANEAAQALHNQEALAQYLALADEFPEQPQTFEAMGGLYVRLQNYEAARQNYEEALRLGVKSVSLFAQYGYVLSQLGHKAEAILMYDEALKINPHEYLVIENRSSVLGELGDYENALAGFQEVTRIAPQFLDAHLNAASILIHFQKYHEAEKEIFQVLKAEPRHAQAQELLKKIPNANVVIHTTTNAPPAKADSKPKAQGSTPEAKPASQPSVPPTSKP